MLDDIATGVIVGIFGGIWNKKVFDRRAERQKNLGIVECSLRDPSRTLSRLLRRWRTGKATLDKGMITFRPALPPGTRIRRPFTSPIQIPVVAINKNHRTPSGFETWWVGVMSIAQIDTGEVVLEWSLPPQVRDWAVATVLPDEDPIEERTNGPLNSDKHQ